MPKWNKKESEEFLRYLLFELNEQEYPGTVRDIINHFQNILEKMMGTKDI